MHLVVAVDGPAASGKGTLSRRLAEELNLAYLDTGSLYRATALRVLAQNCEQGLDADNAVSDAAAAAAAMTVTAQDLAHQDLRTEKVAEYASILSKNAAVRRALLHFQRSFCESPPTGSRGVVLDGRDIGTVICPSAPVKFFVTADIAIRASRRHNELVARGFDIEFDQVKGDIQRRDHRDLTRTEAPLQAPPDACVLDTSDCSPEQAFSVAMQYVRIKFPSFFV